MDKICSVCKQQPTKCSYSGQNGEALWKCLCGHWKQKEDRIIYEDADTARPTLHFLV